MEKSNPQNPIYKRNMAASFNNLASISERLGDVVSAREYYRQALEARERWSALDPASHEATWQTANSHLLLGQVSLYTGDPALALQAFAEAANLRQSIPADSVERVMYDQEWAWQHDRMAEASIRLGNLAEARQHYDTSLELRKKLVDAAAPRSGVQLRRDLASSYLKIGDMSFLFDKDLNQAEAYYQQSLNVCEELRALDPRNSDVRADLATTHYKLGSLKQHLGLAASKEHYQECLAIRAKLAAAAAQDQMAQADLMLAMARCGQHAKAAVIAERLREQLPQNPAIQYQVACCYAISMGDIAAEAAADSNDAQQLAEKYRASAIEAIRQAIASGWKDLVTIRTNPELDPIRQLEEFQRVTHAPQ
jgi:tetratricopeptide (TPR) repeat protein